MATIIQFERSLDERETRIMFQASREMTQRHVLSAGAVD